MVATPIRLALAGVEEAVAGLGTALTEDQAALIAKLTRNVFLVYDGDRPGQKATVKAGHALLRLGVAPRVVSLPGDDDPAEGPPPAATAPPAVAAAAEERMSAWRRRLFIALAHNAANPAEVFRLPDDRTVVMGSHVEL